MKTFLYKRWISFQDRFGLYDYSDWIRENEPGFEALEIQKRQSYEFLHRPLVSAMLVFGNDDFNNINHTLTSLLAQTYDNWEACCFLPLGGIDACLRRIAQDDQRIHLFEGNFEDDFFMAGNAITANTIKKVVEGNDYLKGEFLLVIKPGDTISPSLLFRMVEKLNQTSDIDIFYTDEDHLTQDTRTRHSPFFKPSWSPELLYAVNYLKFAIIRKTQILDVMARYDPGIQFEDLVLRCTVETTNICHLAEVMIHFLDDQNSTNITGDLNRHVGFIKARFEKMGITGVQVTSLEHGALHITWQIPQPLVSIIIPTKDHINDLQCAIETIRKITKYDHYELVIVDNESNDPAILKYYEQLGQSPDVRIVNYPGKFNFSAALNLGASQAGGDVFLFLNNDIQIIDGDWLIELVRWALLPEVGIVGAKLLYPNGKIQHAGIVVGMEGHANHIFANFLEGTNGIFGSVEWYRNYSALTGACMAMRRQIFEEVGGFNSEYQIAFSDVDICQQVIKQGYRVMYNPFARLIHHEGRTRSRTIPLNDIKIGYFRLQEAISSGDPNYNPNLSYAIRYPTFKRKNEVTTTNRLAHIVSALTHI